MPLLVISDVHTLYSSRLCKLQRSVDGFTVLLDAELIGRIVNSTFCCLVKAMDL